MLRTIERPTNATLRPCSAAMSMICWMRCTCEAKRRHDDAAARPAGRPRRARGRCRARSRRSRAPRRWCESTSSRSTPSSPSRAKPRRSVMRPSSGSWSILKSPVCSTTPAGGADRHGQRVRDRVVDREELELERPEPLGLPSRTSRVTGCDPVLAQLRLDEGQRQPRADQRDVRALAQQVGHRADVVLVPVREHDGLDVVEPVADRSRSRGGSGRRRAGSPRGTARRSRRSSSRPPNSKTVMLRPISPSPPSATMRRRAVGERRAAGGARSMAHAVNPRTPPSARSARSMATLVVGGVDERQAHRPGRAGPELRSAALVRMTPWVRKSRCRRAAARR